MLKGIMNNYLNNTTRAQILTIASFGHGAIILPNPLTGSKNGITNTSSTAESGAW